MDKQEVKRLILKEGLTVMDVIDVLAELNGMEGLGFVALGVDLKAYCVNKVKGQQDERIVRLLAERHDINEGRRIRMIVIDENVLAYSNEGSNFGNVLHASILKGSNARGGDRIYLEGRTVRTATRKDFDDFSVSIDGYLKGDGIFEYIIAD